MTASLQTLPKRHAPAAVLPLTSTRGRNAPLRLALLNLMPNKPVTERHFRAAFSEAAQTVEWVLTVPNGYRPTTTPDAHLRRFYTPWSGLDLAQLDGLIVTGAPVEHLPFQDVRYWPALTRILDQARARRLPSLFICWGAQAALYHHHGVPKRALPKKCFGVFEQQVVAAHEPVLEGLAPRFYCPVSRHTECRLEDLPIGRGLKVLAESADSGLCLIAEPAADSFYMFNHLEYETDTLAQEYARDVTAGNAIQPPANCYSHRLPGNRPVNLWHSAARRFFTNWAATLQPRGSEASSSLNDDRCVRSA